MKQWTARHQAAGEGPPPSGTLTRRGVPRAPDLRAPGRRNPPADQLFLRGWATMLFFTGIARMGTYAYEYRWKRRKARRRANVKRPDRALLRLEELEDRRLL